MMQYPWLLLICLPILWYVWQTTPQYSIRILRFGMVISITLGIGNPVLQFPSTSQDVIVVVDRSDSMPSSITKDANEWIQNIESRLSNQDRLAVISVASTVQINKSLSSESFVGFDQLAETEQSNIREGLERALQIAETSEHASILLLSDGAGTDGGLTNVQTKALMQGIPIHTIAKSESQTTDVYIADLQAPTHLNEGEQATITTLIESNTNTTANITLYKDDIAIAQGAKELQKGSNTIQFSDVSTTGGVHSYRLEVKVQGDTTPENNTAEVGILTKGRKRVLVLSQTPSVITTVLSSAGVRVVERSPSEIVLSPTTISQFQAVILHNVPATAFTEITLQNLAHAVQHKGLGLWMIGGKLSFGVGGYLHTPLEDVLPVELEIRDDIRKMGMALGISLDRSGSMSARVGPNLTKMDLANQGTVAALELLNQMDHVYVAAVDTENHTVLEVQPVTEVRSLQEKVLGIQSTGGGIYVSTALRAQQESLNKAPQKNKHIVLFADAADAEDDDNSIAVVEELAANNMTLSVIALGRPEDVDAPFLANLARIGGGSIYFSEDPQALPKLFSMDTMIASKSGYFEEPTNIRSIMGLTALGGGMITDFPTINAYNIAYPKANMQTGLQTNTEEVSPILVSGRFGLGKTVAYLSDIGGNNGQEILQWTGFTQFVYTITSAISQVESTETPYVGISRQGQRQFVTIESVNGVPTVEISDGHSSVSRLDFKEIQPNLYQAAYTPKKRGILLTQLQTDKGVVSLPPISQVTSSEFTVKDPVNNRALLMQLSERSLGKFNPSLDDIIDNDRLHSKRQSLETLWQLLTLCLLLLEVAERKLGWLSQLVARILQKTSKVPTTVPWPKATPSKSSTEPKKSSVQSAKKSTPTKVKVSTPIAPPVENEPKKFDALQDALQRAKKDKSE